MFVCDKCGSVRPNWVHYWAEWFLLCHIGLFIWVFYCLRPLDYFRDMRRAFKRIRKTCVNVPS